MTTRNLVGLRIRMESGTELTLRGREAWALEELLRAGRQGVTPISRPAPRWSDYIKRLRAKGIVIATLSEPHDGPYHGRHGRYVLTSPLTVIETTYEVKARVAH
ncbi:MAG TPA: hypothetical protein VEZ24_02900 [Microvirga sp.]|nr:hypothetical protein [Microvirga sp.]